MDSEKQSRRGRAFDPSNPRYRYRLWVARPTKHGRLLHIFWKRLSAAVVVGIVAGWFALALAAMLFVEARHGIGDVRYLDIAFPWRWERYHRTIAAHYLSDARTLLKNGSYRPALAHLTAGLAVIPEDVESRKLLAVLQYRFGRGDVAAQTLQDGLRYAEATPQGYEPLLTLLRELHQEPKVAEIAQAQLPATADTQPLHLYLALQLSLADLDLGRDDACRETIHHWRLDHSPQGCVLLARCQFEEGDHKGAIAALEQASRRFSDRSDLYLMLVRFAREDGDYSQMRHYALLRYLDQPKAYEARLDLIYAYAETKDEKSLAEEADRYLKEFSGSEAALQGFATIAASSGRSPLSEAVYAVAKQRHLAMAPFRIGLVQAAITGKDYQRALAALRAGNADLGEGAPDQKSLLLGLTAVAQAGSGDIAGADSTLKLLSQDTRSLRSSEALFLAKEMETAGGATESYILLQLAHDRDPANAAATIALVKADIATKNHDALAQHLPALLTLQRPEADLARSALPLLNQPGDAALRSQIRHLGEPPES